MTKKSLNQKHVRLGLLALIAAVITAVIATIGGCGSGDNNPGDGNRFSMFTLTTSVEPADRGTISRDPYATSYQNGTEVTLTATPAAGYRFAGWSDTSLLQVSPMTITMTRNISITANFVPISTPDGHTLTITRTPSDGGTVTRSPDLTHYPDGTEVTVVATAEPGYAFDGWSGAVDTAVRIITVVMDEDKELTAHFLPAPHKLTTSATAGGSVTVDPEQDSYAHNARVTATAHAEPGYVFVRWTGASALSSNPVTITMNADRELNAIFELIGDNHFTLTTGAIPPNGGTVIRNPEAEAYALGARVALKAVPEASYRFNGWTGEDFESQNAEDTIIISSDMVVFANFQPGYTLTVNKNLADGGTVTPESGSSYDVNTHVNITATPASGYEFINWTSTDGTVSFGNANSANTTVYLNSNMTITANFRMFTLTVLPIPCGTVSRADAPPFNITVTLSPGCTFDGWTVTSGTATFDDSSSASTTVTLSTDATIRANFQLIVIPDNFTDTRDEQTYRIVTIGPQAWMAENLNWAGDDGNLGGCYNNAPDSCAIYGRLYDWVAAMDLPSSCNLTFCANQVQYHHRGICPSGWHVPTIHEWNALSSLVGGASTAGEKLKATSGWRNNSSGTDGGGTDDFGFSAMPGGYRWFDDGFYNAGALGYWWSTNESATNQVLLRSIDTGNSVEERSQGKGLGASVRCVRND